MLSPKQFGSTYFWRATPAADRWRSIEEAMRQSANFVGRRSALLSDFLKPTLLGNYFESYNKLRWALLAESFLPGNKLMLDGILSVGRQVRPPHSGPRIGAPVASLRSRVFRASISV